MSLIKNVISALKANSTGLVLPQVDRYLLGRNQVYDSIDEWIHPSSVPSLETICCRSLFFDKFTPIEKYPKKLLIEDHSPRTHRIFDNGHAVHRRWQAYLVESGIVDPIKGVGWEVPIVDEALGIRGHLDAIAYPDSRNEAKLLWSDHGSPVLTLDGFILSCPYTPHFTPTGAPVVVDIKSMRDSYWRMLFEPTLLHQVQLTCYMAVKKIKNSVLIYESKDTQEAKEFIFPFNPTLWALLHKVFSTIQRHLKKKTLPDRICESILCDRAHGCDWKDQCFQISSYEELIQIKGAKHVQKSGGKARR